MNRAPTLLPVAALLLAACGSDEDNDNDAGDEPSAGEAIVVDHAWARTSPAGVTTGALYFDITAADGDTLLAASVPSAIAGAAQIHEVVPAPTDMSSGEMTGHEMSGEMSGDTGDGEVAMVMQELVDGLPLPADETVSLAPGGYHVMLLDLAAPLEPGDEFDVTLDLSSADDMTISVTVGDAAPES
jgi:copper(I)-binding protein